MFFYCENLYNRLKDHGNICVPLVCKTSEEVLSALAVVSCAREISFVEIRVDKLLEDEMLKLQKGLRDLDTDLGIIITNRSKVEDPEGGSYDGTPCNSANILSQFIGASDYLDIEFSAGSEAIRSLIKQVKAHHGDIFGSEKLVLSFHDFIKTPSLDELKDKIKEMAKFNPGVYKIAVQPKTESDVQRIYKLQKFFEQKYPGKKYIFISMDKLGRETRISVPKNGGLLSFGALNEKSTSAPGQIPYLELYKKINNSSE